MKVFVLEDNPQRNTVFAKRYAQDDLTIGTNLGEACALWHPPYDLVCLDHDLGDPYQEGIETGLEFIKLVDWSTRPNVIVHSYNPVGAMAMAQALIELGCKVTIAPFRP